MNNTYGRFSKDGSEYVITNPDTPRPRINYLTNGSYCALCSQAGSKPTNTTGSGNRLPNTGQHFSAQQKQQSKHPSLISMPWPITGTGISS
jgi:hypothetical protein